MAESKVLDQAVFFVYRLHCSKSERKFVRSFENKGYRHSGSGRGFPAQPVHTSWLFPSASRSFSLGCRQGVSCFLRLCGLGLDGGDGEMPPRDGGVQECRRDRAWGAGKASCRDATGTDIYRGEGRFWK